MVDPGSAREDDGAAEEPPEDDVSRQVCRACGGAIAEILLSLGSIDCHDCRGGLRAA
jgi:hypothetical protein